MASLPQTHNALSKTERSRLVRSNRKLQALLGATPQMIEAAVSQSAPPRVNHAQSEASPSSSMPPPPSSFTSRRHLAPKTLTLTASDPTRPCMRLHLESQKSYEHTRSLPSPLTPPTPLSPTTNTPTTPPSTVSRTLSTKDTRRRHAAKLARTLGENIAPELVVEAPARPSLHRAPSSVGHAHPAPKRPSLRSFFSSAPAPAPAPNDSLVAVTPPLPTAPIPSGPRSGKTTTLARSFSTATRAPRSTVDRAKKHRRGGSLAFFSERAADRLAEKEAREVEGAQILTAVRLDLQTGKRRKEKEWSGEWNREMDAVKMRLRSLK